MRTFDVGMLLRTRVPPESPDGVDVEVEQGEQRDDGGEECVEVDVVEAVVERVLPQRGLGQGGQAGHVRQQADGSEHSGEATVVDIL